jgi:uncharacterized membrane protein
MHVMRLTHVPGQPDVNQPGETSLRHGMHVMHVPLCTSACRVQQITPCNAVSTYLPSYHCAMLLQVAQPSSLSFTPLILVTASQQQQQSQRRTCRLGGGDLLRGSSDGGGQRDANKAQGSNWSYVYVPGGCAEQLLFVGVGLCMGAGWGGVGWGLAAVEGPGAQDSHSGGP